MNISACMRDRYVSWIVEQRRGGSAIHCIDFSFCWAGLVVLSYSKKRKYKQGLSINKMIIFLRAVFVGLGFTS